MSRLPLGLLRRPWPARHPQARTWRPRSWNWPALGLAALVLSALLANLAVPGSAPATPAAAQALGERLHLPLLVQGRGPIPFPPTALPGPEPSATATGPTLAPTGTLTATLSATASVEPTAGSPTATAATPGGSPSATPHGSATAGTVSATPTGATPTASPSPATEVPSATPSPGGTVTPLPGADSFGVQVFGNEPGLATILDEAQGAGTRWVRVLMEWRWIEMAPGQRHWAFWDGFLADLDRRGFRVLATVVRHPDWLPAPSNTCYLAPAHLDAFRDFLAAAAERYDGDGVDDAPGSPRVLDWQLGNEPDFAPSRAGGEGDYGSCFGDDPAAYGQYLAAGYAAVTGAAPEARVVFGGLAYDRFHDKPDYLPQHRGPFRYNFLRTALEAICPAGQAPWPPVHTFALHNYNDFRDNWDGPGGTAPELIGKVGQFRASQLTGVCGRDLSTLPVLVSEVSLSSAPSNPYIARSEDRQAAYVGRVMVRALAVGAPGAIWFTAEDHGGGDCAQPDDWQLFGLLRNPDMARRAANCSTNPLPGYNPARPHEPKPALTAYRTAAGLLGGARYHRQLSAAETGRPEAEAHLLVLADGREALLAFTDHGAPLGRIVGGTPVPEIEHDLVLGPGLLASWTGRLEIVDMLGRRELRSGETVTVRLSYQPRYLVVAP